MEREEEGGQVKRVALEAVELGFFEVDGVGDLGFLALEQFKEEEVAWAQ